MTPLDRVMIAFRKLKANAYFDKIASSLRDAIVAFESSPDFDEKLRTIAGVYEKDGFSNDSPLMEEILSSIDILPFPKKMTGMDPDGKEAVVSIGFPSEKPEIDDLQFFIDMDVRGHILGVLWVMFCGKQIDEQNIATARGNRLRKSLVWDEAGAPLETSALFEPYFAQYSLWRDGGLSVAEGLLEKGHDALILTLDLTRFYYRTGITRAAFEGIIDLCGNLQHQNLHGAIYSILEKYTCVLKKHQIQVNEVVLPIGFLPSAVLSNWCLAKFDRGILDYWNPSYYGRYVDDIIIVDKVEKKSKIYNLMREGKLNSDWVINYYLGDGRRKATPVFASREGFANSHKVQGHKVQGDENRECYPYRVHPKFCLTDQSVYELQSKKIRVFGLFSDNNSSALISKFKREIYENVSEFRLMPEIGDAFSQEVFCDFYKLENDATINKLHGIREILVDKYELSKFLGRYRVVSSLVEDAKLKRTLTSAIGKMFNDRELIEYYILWERIFEIFITDEDYDGLISFAKRIRDAIGSLTINGNSKTLEMISESEICALKGLIKNNLHKYCDAVLNRVLSLVWGENANKIVKEAYANGQLAKTRIWEIRKNYITTYMSNKYIMPIPAELIAFPTGSIIQHNVNFTKFNEGFKYLSVNNIKTRELRCLPYFRHAQDIACSSLLEAVCSDSFVICQENSNNNCRELSLSQFEKIKSEIIKTDKDSKEIDIVIINKDNTLQCEESENNNKGHTKAIFKVGNEKSDKLKIAIANVNVSTIANLENKLKDKKPNRRYARYRDLAGLVNSAIKESADILVLPENYVPFEWLSTLASKSAKEGLAIITGVEHLVESKSNKVYNFTAVILPLKYYDHIPTAAVAFQLKNHYAPGEKQLIEGYGYNVAKGDMHRPLYCWKDCYFPVYTCFELSSITERSEYISWADMVVAVEFNRDTNYFANIIESLTRDLHCYCVQVNTSEYGDSRISQPTKRELQNLVLVKGGLNQSLLIGEIDIQSLREFQLQDHTLQKNGTYKPTPPGFNAEVVRLKLLKNKI